MPSTPSRVRRRKTAALALMTATMVPGLAQIPALATSPTVASTDLQHVVDGLVATLGDTVPGLSDLDLRGRVLWNGDRAFVFSPANARGTLFDKSVAHAAKQLRQVTPRGSVTVLVA